MVSWPLFLLTTLHIDPSGGPMECRSRHACATSPHTCSQTVSSGGVNDPASAGTALAMMAKAIRIEENLFIYFLLSRTLGSHLEDVREHMSARFPRAHICPRNHAFNYALPAA